MENKIQMSLIRINIKIILVAVMIINKYVLVINSANVVHTFITNTVEESKYGRVIKKHFNEELVMTKEDNENFENSTKCWICDNTFV